MTSTWSDGSRGPLGICIPENFIDADTVGRFNANHRGQCYVFSSQSPSHFMSAESMIRYLKGVVTDAIGLQRKKYKLAPSIRGLLLYDGWTGYHSFRDGLDLSRQSWADSNNFQLGDQQCGGWSANCQPCDQFHSLLRSRLELLDADGIGCTADMRQRQPYDEMAVTANGQLKRPKADSFTLMERTYHAWISMPGSQLLYSKNLIANSQLMGDLGADCCFSDFDLNLYNFFLRMYIN